MLTLEVANFMIAIPRPPNSNVLPIVEGKNGNANAKHCVNPVMSRLYIPDVNQTPKFESTKNATLPAPAKPKNSKNLAFFEILNRRGRKATRARAM